MDDEWGQYGEDGAVEKALMAPSGLEISPTGPRDKRRGLTVYNSTQLLSATGFTKDGNRLTTTYEAPYFVLTISERIDMYRMCSPIFGVITGRMNRIAGMEWHVSADKSDEDRIAQSLKELRALYQEYADDFSPRGVGIKVRCASVIMRRLPDIKTDLSNFDMALLRWKRRIQSVGEDMASEAEEWLQHPNQSTLYEDFVKQAVCDLHIHGAFTPYKEAQGGRLENFYALPGGATFPIKGRFVGDPTGYVQIVDGFEPRIMFKDECSFLQYAPRSDNSYGSIPLEALVNKVAESLLFDQRAAEMADGTKPPEKLVLFGDHAPFSELGDEYDVPLPKSEQKRLETMINEVRKEAVRVISGYGTPAIVDVSRADTFGQQSERQRMVREEVGLVFGASPTEMNLSGSDSTSGRSTSETQERYDLYKGIYPVIQILENFINYDILPYRFKGGISMKYEPMISEGEKIDLLAKKASSGLYSVNEVRTEDMGRDPFPGKQYDEPAAPQAAEPGSAEGSPSFVRQV